jgi:catecholate siderophore receptor
MPYFEGKPLDVPVDRFYGMANANDERNRTGIATATWSRRFDFDTSLRMALRKADYPRDLNAVAPRLAGTPAFIADDTIVNPQRQSRGGEEHTLTSQNDLTAVRMLAGVEFVREDADRWTLANDVPNPPTSVGSPDANPPLPPEYFTSVRRTNPVSYHAETVGLYAQDLVELSPEWKVLAGARFDHFEAEYARAEPDGPLARLDRQWSYRTGVLYQPTRASTYYFAWGTSYNPTGELYALDDRTANTPPEKNRSPEIGAKWDVLHGELSLRAAIFRSEKLNERNTDLAQPDIALLSGKRGTPTASNSRRPAGSRRHGTSSAASR